MFRLTVLALAAIISGPGPVNVKSKPPFSGDITQLDRSTFLAYASQLSFNTAHWAAETDYIMLSRSDNTFERGPLATIAAQMDVMAMSEEDLEAGRIIARVEVAAAVPGRGYGAGMNYLWFYKSNGDWRMIVMPADPTVAPTELEGKTAHYGMGKSDAPIARLQTETAWTQCISGCCSGGRILTRPTR